MNEMKPVEAPQPKALAEMIRSNTEPRKLAVQRGDGQAADILLIPKEMQTVDLKPILDSYRLVPERRQGTVTLDRLPSLIDVANRFKSANSVLFARAKIAERSIEASIRAIFDYHPAGGEVTQADNCKHSAIYNFPVAETFKAWLDNNMKPMNQADFALFLEERHIEMAAPEDADSYLINGLKPKFADPLEMLSLSRDLEIYSNESFKSKTRLASGETAIQFSAEHVDANGQAITLPDFFMLNLPLFEGGDNQRIHVRLRYRLQNGKVIWFYDLYRIDRAMTEAFETACASVQSATDLPIFFGTA